MRYADQVVPVADSARNQSFREVVGNKNDTYAGTSLKSESHRIDEHIHKACRVYPTLAAGVAVAGGAGAWALSAAFIEVVPALAIGAPFDIHHVNIEALDDNTTYELWLYAVEVFIGHIRFTKNANLDSIFSQPFQDDIIPADTQIQAKLASAAGNSVATISLFYHEY